MTPKGEGRHRVSEVPPSDTTSAPLGRDNQASVTGEPHGPFAVQLLEGHWFIGLPGAMQRIEDADWLDDWLAANGSTRSDSLDFSGDRELEQRFLAEIGARPPC